MVSFQISLSPNPDKIDASFGLALDSSILVLAVMARSAKSNQVLLGIFSTVTAKILMVNFEIGHCTTELASPTITAKNLVPQMLVQLAIKPGARLFR